VTPITVTIPSKQIHTTAMNWISANCSCPSWSLSINESALRSALANLYDCGSSLHWWLELWTYLVVAGVALEIVFVVWEYVDELHDCRRCLLHPPVSPNRALFILGFFGAGLVAVGVAGELNAGARIATVETCIRKGNDELSLLLSKEANDAATSAQNAKADAAGAKVEADSAGVAAGKAQDKANAVGTRAEQLNRELASEEVKLNAVDAKRAELETSLKNLAVCTAPRIIPDWFSRGTSVGDPIKAFAGWTAILEYVPFDAEARRAASNIYGALKNAGWKVTIRAPSDDNFADGLEVQGFQFPDSERANINSSNWQIEVRSREVGGKVVRFLHSYNWDARLGWMGNKDSNLKLIPQDGIRIRVGLYPPTTFVVPPAMKDLAAAIASQQQMMDNQKRSARERELKELENMRERFPEGVAEREKLNRKLEEELETYSSPCKPLEPLFPSF
jgi:hypothetical protein